MKIAGIYLAGGNSRRMGTSKLALPVGTMTLGSLGLETILQSSLKTVYVIVQESDDIRWIPDHLQKNPKCMIIHCTDAQYGQSETLKCGIHQVLQNQIDAALIFLADQPFITVQLIENMMICLQQNTATQFVATTYDHVIYPPVLFKKELFHTLFKIKGDYGAKAILKGDILNHGTMLPCDDQRLIWDVDTKEDFVQFLKHYSSS